MEHITDALRGGLQGLEGFKAYMAARIAERSTWAAIGIGATAAAGIPDERLKWVAVGCAVIGALVPTGGQRDA